MKKPKHTGPPLSIIPVPECSPFAMVNGQWFLAMVQVAGRYQLGNWEKPYSLFDLDIDPLETTNMIDKYPEVAERLTTEVNRIRNNGSSK